MLTATWSSLKSSPVMSEIRERLKKKAEKGKPTLPNKEAGGGGGEGTVICDGGEGIDTAPGGGGTRRCAEDCCIIKKVTN